MKRLLMAGYLSITALFFMSTAVLASEIKLGQLAPEFTLVNQHGENISLKSKRGQWVVLYFYPKNDTPGCTTEACGFRDNINRLIAQKATVLGVSVDTQQSHQAFAEKYRLPFPILADEDGAVAEKYGSLLNLIVVKFAKRHSFIIDPQGRIAKIYRYVNPDMHVREVMHDLKKLQQGLDENP